MQISPVIALVLAAVLFIIGSLFLGQIIQTTASFIAGIPLIVLGILALLAAIYLYKPEVFTRVKTEVQKVE